MQRDNKTKEQSSKWWTCYLIFVENDTNRRMFEDPHAEPPPPETPSLGSVFGMFGPQTQTNQWHSTCTTRILLVTFYHCHSFCYIFIMLWRTKNEHYFFLLNRWKPSCQHDIYFDIYCVDRNSQSLVQICVILSDIQGAVYSVKTCWDVPGINKICRDMNHIWLYKITQLISTHVYIHMARVYIHVHVLFCCIGQSDLGVRCTCILRTCSVFLIND